jgi:hypothetical protein
VNDGHVFRAPLYRTVKLEEREISNLSSVKAAEEGRKWRLRLRLKTFDVCSDLSREVDRPW